MPRSRYSVDKNNRLVISTKKKRLRPAGIFFINKKNQLIYQITEPKIWRKKYNLPNKKVFEGTWQLDKKHKLIFILRKTKKQFAGDRLYFRGQIVDVSSSSIGFAVASQPEKGVEKIRLLKLNGRWQADKFNRLTFLVQKSQATYNTLTLQGAWQVRNNNLIYRYKTTPLKTKTRIEETLIFKGFWQISNKNRLTYVLDLKNKSYFSFKVHFGSPSIRAKARAIKYRVGIGGRGKDFRTRIITLYGAWKIGRKTGLSFEIDYGHKNLKQIRFEVSLNITSRNKVVFGLKSEKGHPLGINISFTRKFLKNNARWFLRLGNMSKNPKIEAGLSLLW